MLSGGCVSEQDLPLFFDDVITLAGRHEVPATKFELLTAVALKLLRDTRVEWAGLGKMRRRCPKAQSSRARVVYFPVLSSYGPRRSRVPTSREM